jgi:hypothetical protein
MQHTRPSCNVGAWVCLLSDQALHTTAAQGTRYHVAYFEESLVTQETKFCRISDRRAKGSWRIRRTEERCMKHGRTIVLCSNYTFVHIATVV